MNLQMLVRRALLAAALLACALARPASANAQAAEASAAADTVYEIRLRDGSVLVGRIVSDAGASLVVQTPAG